MSKSNFTNPHPVAERRKARGWSQDDLAAQVRHPAQFAERHRGGAAHAICHGGAGGGEGAGVQRGGACLAPALRAVSKRCNGPGSRDLMPAATGRPRSAEGTWLYPVEALPGSAWAHDGLCRAKVLHERGEWDASQTLVLAGCDPAAGLLAAEYAAASGFRLLAFSRGGGAAMELAQARRGACGGAASLHRREAGAQCRDGAREARWRLSPAAQRGLAGGHRAPCG